MSSRIILYSVGTTQINAWGDCIRRLRCWRRTKKQLGFSLDVVHLLGVFLGVGLTAFSQTNLANYQSTLRWAPVTTYENGILIKSGTSIKYQVRITYPTNNYNKPIIIKFGLTKNSIKFSNIVGQRFPKGLYKAWVRTVLPNGNYSRWNYIDFYYEGNSPVIIP